jgi:hypothetical protein
LKSADEPKVTSIQPPGRGFFSKQVFCEGTFATHPWMAVNHDGKVIGVFVPDDTNGRVILE